MNRLIDVGNSECFNACLHHKTMVNYVKIGYQRTKQVHKIIQKIT